MSPLEEIIKAHYSMYLTNTCIDESERKRVKINVKVK